MWECPNCGRSFRNKNQSHYCTSKPDTIDVYIKEAPQERREVLHRVREAIRASAPDAVEKISWDMPTFWQGENLIHFAVFKNHLGLYPGEDGVKAFSERLSSMGFKFSKGAVQIPWNKPMPYDLIKEITKYRVSKVTKT